MNTNTSQVIQYFYDADGLRENRVGPQGTTRQLRNDRPPAADSADIRAQAILPDHRRREGIDIPSVNPAEARVTCRFNRQPVAMREGGTLTFVYGNHLGSAGVTANISGTKVSELLPLWRDMLQQWDITFNGENMILGNGVIGKEAVIDTLVNMGVVANDYGKFGSFLAFRIDIGPGGVSISNSGTNPIGGSQ